LSVFGISLLGGLIPSAFVLVKDVLMRAVQWFAGVIARLLARTESTGGEAYDASVPEPQEVYGEGGGRELNLPPFLETLILYIGAAISVAFMLWILYRICKKIVKAAREGWILFGKFLTAASEDYVDEVTYPGYGQFRKTQGSQKNPAALSGRPDAAPWRAGKAPLPLYEANASGVV